METGEPPRLGRARGPGSWRGHAQANSDIAKGAFPGMAATPKSATPVPPAPEPANPKPRHRTRNLAIAVVVIVVAIVVGVSIYWYEYRPGGPLNPYHVNVSEVIWTTDGNFYSDSAGFSLIAGKSVPLQIVL